MPIAENRGIKIHYEVEGSGPPILLIHGPGTGVDIWWTTGYVQELRSAHRLVLIDPRGQGGSDRLNGGARAELNAHAEDTLAVLDHLGVAAAHYIGYDLGAEIGWKLAGYSPGRFRSLLLGGGAPTQPRRDTFHTTTVPFLVWAGEFDPIHTAAEEAACSRGACFVSLSGLDHAGAMEHSECVLPHVWEFLASCGATGKT